MWWWWCKIKFFHLLVIHLASILISFATSLIICYYYVSSLLWNMHFYFTYYWLIYRGSLRLLSWIFLVFLHCCWWFLCCTVSTCYLYMVLHYCSFYAISLKSQEQYIQLIPQYPLRHLNVVELLQFLGPAIELEFPA